MEVFFLAASVPLTKRYTQQANGSITADSYPHVVEFRSHQETIQSIEDLECAITKHAALGHCLLKGQLTKPLDFESRAGSTDPNTPTEFLVIDVDGLPNYTPEQVVEALDMKNVDYIVQYSSSQGVLPSKGLSCHIFVLLTHPIAPNQIKQWLIQKNLELFSQHITLTKSGVALHYPIDITACQNDKLIYIAPPICVPKTLDRFAKSRIITTLRENTQKKSA